MSGMVLGSHHPTGGANKFGSAASGSFGYGFATGHATRTGASALAQITGESIADELLALIEAGDDSVTIGLDIDDGRYATVCDFFYTFPSSSLLNQFY